MTAATWRIVDIDDSGMITVEVEAPDLSMITLVVPKHLFNKSTMDEAARVAITAREAIRSTIRFGEPT